MEGIALQISRPYKFSLRSILKFRILQIFVGLVIVEGSVIFRERGVVGGSELAQEYGEDEIRRVGIHSSYLSSV